MSRYYDGPKGWRPRCDWGDGELPAPFALGDVIDVPPSAPVAEDERRLGRGGRWRVVSAFSISEGDDWYFRACPVREDGKTEWSAVSGRLHVFADRNTLAGAQLVSTEDPDGLAERERLLAGGWAVATEQAPRLALRAAELASDLRRCGLPGEADVVAGVAEGLRAQ